MAYIYLDELREILPGILDQWIDKDDECWETWIFQEIEQKCHIGKKKKDKKKKTKIESMVIAEQRNDINELNQRVTDFIKDYGADIRNSKEKINNLSDKYVVMTTRINRMDQDITAAKSMAEIAKNRTEVDYTKPNRISYTLWGNAQQIIKVCGEHGATKEELEQLDLILSKYVPNPAMVTNPEDNDCKNCKHYCDSKIIKEPCVSCDAYQYWEAKEVNRYEDSN